MAAEATFTITGLKQLQERLLALGRNVRVETGNALRAEGEVIMTEAKKRTPVLTGALRASGQVAGPGVEGGALSVTLGFGGPAAEYALFVHENMAAHHPNGQSKFLESAVLEAVSTLASRIARRIKL